MKIFLKFSIDEVQKYYQDALFFIDKLEYLINEKVQTL